MQHASLAVLRFFPKAQKPCDECQVSFDIQMIGNGTRRKGRDCREERTSQERGEKSGGRPNRSKRREAARPEGRSDKRGF
jgi:hypothetical protein